MNWKPRAPLGPSVRPMPGDAEPLDAAVCHMSAPAVSVACSSSGQVGRRRDDGAVRRGATVVSHDALPNAARSAAPASAAGDLGVVEHAAGR